MNMVKIMEFMVNQLHLKAKEYLVKLLHLQGTTQLEFMVNLPQGPVFME